MTIRKTFARLAGALAAAALTAGTAQAAETVLFVGNSFTYGAYSPVWKYRASSVTDLNNEGVGGVPALFKLFTTEAGLDYTVSLETAAGQGLDYHLANKKAVLDKAWDHVVMHGYSTLDRAKPGDAGLLVATAAEAARMFQAQNSKVDIHLTSTWSRADMTYSQGSASPWTGKPIAAMGLDLRKAYDLAAAGSPYIRTVIPVGEAFNRAFATGVADSNPYDGIAAGQVNLWTYDNYHASTYGYYLEALMVFGRLTGKDPISLGGRETAAAELGMSPAQASALQKIAHDELAAYTGKVGSRS
ncbi:hypothetical protein BH11PSE2_BH11PSE2_19320 [soil metagenome]